MCMFRVLIRRWVFVLNLYPFVQIGWEASSRRAIILSQITFIYFYGTRDM